MRKNGDYPGGAKVYESKKEKKRRLVMNSDSESEEFVITPRVEILHTGNGAASGRRNKVLEKGGGREKMVTRGEELRRKLGNEGSKGKVIEAMSDRKSREIGVDQSDVGDIKSGYVDSVGNQTDTIGGSSKSSVSLKLSYKFTGSANEKVLESKSGRKRSMETGDDEFSRKKTKAENMDSVDNDTEKSGEGDKSLTIVKHGDKIMDSRTDGVQVSKLPVPRAKQRDEDGSSERDFQPSLKTSSKAEAVRWLGQSGQREPQKVKDARFSDAKKEEDGGSSQHSYIRMRGKSGVLRVLQGSRKDGSENSYVQCKGQGKTKRLGSSGTNRFSMSNHQLERQVDEKSISNIKLGKRAAKVSSEDASKSSVSKVNQETTSRKKVSTNMDLSHSKSGLAAKEKKNTKELNESRSTVKNKIREQIKNILLDAGWRIEFRPRRGRDYEDAVYVSPQGSGYWSITKAYDIYVRQFQSTCDDKESSGKQPKASAERDGDKEANSTYVVIPPEVLLMLKRNVVNKRRRRNEMEDVKRKVGVGRRKKKDKEIAKVKRPKDKGTRNDVGGTRAITRKVTVRNSKRGGCALMVRGSNQDKGSEKGDYAPYVWKRTVLSWMIDLGVLPVYGKVRYMNKRMTRALLDGRLTRDGIQCSCCSKILTVSKFETHAGSKLHQPYENIYLEVSGMSEISLLQCQINAWEKQESKRSNFYDVDTDGDDPNDDTCGICGDGGDLICCDSCPSTFHLCCLGIEMLPTGDWHCTNCSCKFCGSVHDSASQDRNASNALFTCSQCARKYHKDCVPEGDTVVPNSSCNVFCGRSCRKVFRKLQKLSGARNELEPGFYWSIIRRFDEPSKSPSRMTQRVECNSKIAVAYTVMDECFVPITDQRSGINLIHNVVYNCGSNFNRVNFSGFYTFILERGDEVIAAASVRIHDTRVAEMPFIGTRSMYRRQGMCRRLLKGIESALRSLCIRKLIIPAISELTDTWTTVFGFKPLGISQKQELKSVNILVFPGTGLLQKSLLKDSTKKHTNPEPEKNPETQISVKADKSYSPDEVMDSKKSKRDAEAIKPNIPALEHSTNFFPEASGCHAQFYRSSDSAADGESNDLKSVVSFNNHVEKDLSLGNCSNEVVACIEEPKKELVEVTDVLPSFHYPASELLLHGTSGIEALEFRYSQNESNSELPVTDVVENCSSAKEGECPLASLQRLEDKPPSNGIAREVSPKKCEFIEADEDRTHDVNAVKLRHDANGQESNVTEESIEVSVGVIRASELLHGASGIEALELRPPQNEYNSELPVTDVVSYCNSEKEGECRLGSLPKLKDKHPNNGIENVVSPKKCEFIEAGEDRAHAINELTLRNDADGLESNVNDESIELSVDIIGHLNTPGKGSCVSSGVCGNGSRVNSEYYSVASNERTSQEKSELLQYQVKCYVEANDSAPLDRLAVSNSATRLEVEGVSGIVGANSATSEGLLSKLKESTPCINQNFPSIGEVGDDCHDDVCDVSIAENDVGVVEYVHGFELSSVNQASKMVT